MLLLCAFCCAIADDETSEARYIANMGVMIERGSTKVLFDPLFKTHFDIYDPVPTNMAAALIAGAQPWDGIDAVFISHYHGDHVDPEMVLALLRAQTTIRLFAPEQAASAIRELVSDSDDRVLERIHGLVLANGEAAVDIELDSLLIEATRVPHAGWPNRHSHVENLVFRVTLDSTTTVMHLGDADTGHEHYDTASGYWQERRTHLAMPPYWFFLSDEGREVLNDRIQADHAIGMHVPSEVPDQAADRPEEIREFDLFTKPGESREILVKDQGF